MADGSPVKELRCEERRGEIYKRIKDLEDKVATMEGEKKHARYITPLIVSAILLIGGVAVAEYIENRVRKVIKTEFKAINREKPSDTSYLMTTHP